MNRITVRNFDGKTPALIAHLKKVTSTHLHNLKLKNVSVDISLVSDMQIQKLNKKYRGKNKPTDVLSFTVDELVDGKRFLGDIIIANETARRQAKETGHSAREEFTFLALHGLLHLLGYDHETLEDETIMFALQRKLLSYVTN